MGENDITALEGGLGARLTGALASNDAGEVRAVVGDLVDRVRSGDRATIDVAPDVAAALRSARRFDELVKVADAGIQAGGDPGLWAHLAQGLLDGGSRIAADAVITSALTTMAVDHPARLTVLGLSGRSAKDAFIATRDPACLQRSIAAYCEAARSGGDPLWLGVNARALAHHGRRHGIECTVDGVLSETELMQLAGAGADDDEWALATWIEAHLLVGLRLPVDAIVTRLTGASAFVYGSFRRQLREVWELPTTHPGVVALAELMLRLGTSGEVEIPDDDQGYETIFGPDNPIPVDTYRKGLDAARSVCLLTTGKSYPAGTGFVMDGADLHPSLAGRSVLVTNEHVARRPDGEPGVRAEELVARFTAGGNPTPAEGIGGFTGVWWSPSAELDIALLVSPQLVSGSAPPLRPAAALPMVRPGAHCYVVGHPGGGGLQLSIRGNDLIDVDRERLHYRTPTSRGSSGSPVFDQDWDLVGAHHRGSDALKALNGKPGQYEGNEGTTILAVISQLAERPPDLGSAA